MQSIKKYWIYILTAIRIWLALQLPIWAHTQSVHDDALGMELANSLMQGEWLGAYNNRILQKGISFPLFLATISKLNINYNLAIIVLWIGASAFFAYTMREVLSKKSAQILYVMLMYNPIMFEMQIVQRIYRSSLVPTCMLLIISGYLWIYFNLLYDKSRKSWSVAIGIGLVLSFFMNLRDDGIFLYPFIFVITCIILVVAYKKKKNVIKYSLMLGVPFTMVFCSNHLISAMNYKHYGLYITTEPSNSAFREFRDLLYAIEEDEEISCVSVSRAKMKRLYEYSPSLKAIEPHMEDWLDHWSKYDRHPEDKEVEDGWIRWALRDGVSAAGFYKDAATANEFYKTVASELRQAVDQGELKVQKLLPIDVLPVWKSEYISPLVSAVCEAFDKVVNYDSVRSSSKASIGNIEDIRAAEILTNGRAIYPSTYQVTISGWFASDSPHSLELMNITSNQRIPIDFKKSPDVDEYLDVLGQSFVNDTMCRFSKTISLEQSTTKSEWLLVELESGYKVVPDSGLHKDVDGSILHLDHFMVEEVADPYVGRAKYITENINAINTVIIRFMQLLIIPGMLAFGWLFYASIKKNWKALNIWLVALASLLTFLVVAVAEGLLQITAFDALEEVYLVPGYILMMLFFVLPLLGVCDHFAFEKEK